MTINEKIEVLNRLSDLEFRDMFRRLLENQGFSNIEYEDTAIICDRRIILSFSI